MSLVVTQKRSARRCLFGRPTPEQQEATQEMIQNALEEIYRRDMEKWGFDFKLGIPLDEASCSLYIYEAVTEAEVPQYYRTKHISSNESPMSSPSTSDKEDVSLMNISTCSTESEMSIEFEPVPLAKRTSQTPKKRQNKLTDYIPIRRRKVQRSPKDQQTPRRAARQF
ncbi:unnamed protein product [Caenorhabditis bovis]|uniref:Cyclin-dependent kinase inhibitor domain-containing protein n=1 Tax=Caenorhabditis bovis TaxID=2654633 RepID=A0A8S1EJV3_9PELO|nr:unnamed protein product [Caenorhabditis bovis]